MPVCLTLVSRDERRKSEANFEADYVSDSFMDENTESKRQTIILLLGDYHFWDFQTIFFKSNTFQTIFFITFCNKNYYFYKNHFQKTLQAFL